MLTMLSFATPPSLRHPSPAHPTLLASLPFSYNEFDIGLSLPSILTATADASDRLVLNNFQTVQSNIVESIPSSLLPHSFSLFNDAWHLDPSFWEPIELSTLAGLSTCVGASVAFLVNTNNSGSTKDSDDQLDQPNVGVGPDLLAFSLALAGSVMITVSVVSIIPEALIIDLDSSTSDAFSVFGQTISSQVLLRRATGFAVGWSTYAMLSQLLSVLPEEDELGKLLVGTDSIHVASASNAGVAVANTPSASTTRSSYRSIKEGTNTMPTKQSSWRLTILLFLSLLLHNFPEGLAVAFSAASAVPSQSSSIVLETSEEGAKPLQSITNRVSSGIISFNNDAETISLAPHPAITSSMLMPQASNQPNLPDEPSIIPSTKKSSLASIVALSIALHNIPEGIAIAIPCMAARPDKPFLAFGLASLSGLAEPVGAFIGLMILRLRSIDGIPISSAQDMGDALAFVAGIMIAVSICELLPEAIRQQKECDTPDSFVLGIAIGVGVMILTELYLGA